MTAFLKMHGLGNDFVVIDARARDPKVTPGVARAIADRHTGIGCDQLIVIERPRGAGADAFMRIHNADGGEVEACGNAVRCVGAVLMDERGTSASVIETLAGPVRVSVGPGGAAGGITADMGEARLDWRDIPLAGRKRKSESSGRCGRSGAPARRPCPRQAANRLRINGSRSLAPDTGGRLRRSRPRNGRGRAPVPPPCACLRHRLRSSLSP